MDGWGPRRFADSSSPILDPAPLGRERVRRFFYNRVAIAVAAKRRIPGGNVRVDVSFLSTMFPMYLEWLKYRQASVASGVFDSAGTCFAEDNKRGNLGRGGRDVGRLACGRGDGPGVPWIANGRRRLHQQRHPLPTRMSVGGLHHRTPKPPASISGASRKLCLAGV